MTAPVLPLDAIDLVNITGVEDLRRALHAERCAGRVAWCRLNGLSVGRSTTHTALLRFLANLGIGGDGSRARPHTVVLDWSTADGCSADGLAFFGILVRALRAAGYRVVLCEPADGDVARCLEQSGLRVALGELFWVPCRCSPARRVEVVGPAAFFGGVRGRGNVESFLWNLDEALGRTGMNPRRADLLSGIATDLVQNVFSHADGAHAAAVALFHVRRRPPVVEIGVADGGIGVAAHLLRQKRYAWLLPYTDAAVAEAVFGRSLSGRAAEAGGGGLSRLIRRLRDDCGASVLVRSGAGLLSLSGPSTARCAADRLTCGWGTQVLISAQTGH